MKDVVVIKCGDLLLEAWVANMTRLLPEFEILPYNKVIEPEAVRYIIGWCPDARWINQFPKLKAVVSIGSGVDHIEHLSELRSDLPLIRTVAPDLVQRMREFVALCVLAWHRQFVSIFEHNETREWRRFAVGTADTVRVGIMGYGSMGRTAADVLSAIGYDVSVWASSPRPEVKFDYFHGSDKLGEFAKRLDVLICLLPLTSATEGILNYELMSKIRPGGCVINLGRGAHLVDNDLFRLLDNGHLSAAFVDGLRAEPLPSDSPLFDQKNVVVTFHSAAYISPETGPVIIAENIRKFDAGEEVSPMYDRTKGY